MVSSSERGTEENGDKKITLSKSSVFQQRTAALKPLCKHTFYLDVKSRSCISKIEGKIRRLGGNIDIFLDKDVTHIITDKEIPTAIKNDVTSPVTPTQLGENKSLGSQKGGNGGDKTPNHVTGRLKTRVSAMLEKARCAPTPIEKNIFAEAERLSITVWPFRKAICWLDKVSLTWKSALNYPQSSRYNFRSKYYIKFESFDRSTRPVFRELVSWPHVNVCAGEARDGGLVTVVAPPVGTEEAPTSPLEASEALYRNMTRGVGHYGPTVAAFNPNTTNAPSTFTASSTKISAPPYGVVCPLNKPEKTLCSGIISKEDEVQPAEPTTTPNVTILNLNRRFNHRLSSINNKNSNRNVQSKEVKQKLVLQNNTSRKGEIIAGYCELCRVNFANQSEHFVSVNHLKFVGDSNNYTEVDNLIAQGSFEEFLKVNNYQVRSVPPPKPHSSTETLAMSSTRGSQRLSATDLAPTAGATPRYGGGTSTRPRRHTTFTNSYLEISVDDDMMRPPECARETRETRSTRNSQTKPASPESDTWTSGRPKRACIKRKRSSSDDKVTSNNQAYYRVEVLGSKLRSNAGSTTETSTTTNTNSNSNKHRTYNETTTCTKNAESKANSREANGESSRIPTQEEKGLIVKFRRMRNSELRQLNNEAVNFLFPRKDDSSSEEDLDDNCPETTVSSGKATEVSVVISSEDDETVQEINETEFKEQIRTNTKKEEIDDTDENQSLDSNWSDSNKKLQNHKRRRTHAEAFINDNQKYYKFETPGSRLRYQGTFMSTHDLNVEQTIRPRLNGENLVDNEDSVESAEPATNDEAKTKKLRLQDVKYSYELRPASEPWYQTFVRQDQAMESYNCNKSFSEPGYYKPFYLPHQLPPLQALDPRVCFAAYDRLKRLILEAAGISPNNTPCSSIGNSTPTPTNTTQAVNTNDPTAPQNGDNNDVLDVEQLTEDLPDNKARVHEKILALVKAEDEVHSATASEEGNSSSNDASPTGEEGGDGLNDLMDVDTEEGSNSNSSNSQGGGSLSLGEDIVVDDAEPGKKEKGKDVEEVENTDLTRITLEQRRQQRRRQKRMRIKMGTSSGRSPGRNSRKSPRQHASTLAILSLLQQRKRRELNRSKSDLDNSNATDTNGIEPIQEEDGRFQSQAAALTNPSMEPSFLITEQSVSVEAKELAKLVSTIDRMNAAIASATDDVGDFRLDIDVNSSERLMQSYSKTDAIAILEDYEKYKDVLSKTGLSHGANKRSYSPGKKPGRKRKKKRKNMTGWPNKNIRKLSSNNNIKKEIDDSTIDSLSITADSEDLDDTNEVSPATLPPFSNHPAVLNLEVDEYDIKMCSKHQKHRTPSPKPPTNRNSRISSRSSAKSDKLSEKPNKHFIKGSKELKDCKEENETSVSNYSSVAVTSNCVNNKASDNNVGTIKNTTNSTGTNNRVNVNVKGDSFSDNELETEDSLSNCNNAPSSKETKIIDLSHWREHDKLTRTTNSEINCKSETNSAQFQPVVRVEKLNNRQLRSSGVSPSVRGSTSASRSAHGSPTRSASVTRSSTPGSPPRSFSNARGTSSKRTSSRRMPASPRSPRVLRKPRGRWYRER